MMEQHDDEDSLPSNHMVLKELAHPLRLDSPSKSFRQSLKLDNIPSTTNMKKTLKEWLSTKKEKIRNYCSKETWKARLKSLKQLLLSRKFYESLLICYGFIPLGIGISMLGPTMPALQQKLVAEEDSMGLIFTLRGVGYILTSFIGGWVLDFVKKKVHSTMVQTIMNQILLMIGILLIGGSFLAIPFVTTFWLCTVMYFITGLGLGLVDLVSNVLIIWIWGNDKMVSVFLQFLHACFGVGAFICPIIVKFIFKAFETTEEVTQVHPIKNALAVSYFITAGIAFSGLIPIAIFCILAYKTPDQPQETEHVKIQKHLDEISKSFDELEDSNHVGDMVHDIELEDEDDRKIEAGVEDEIEPPEEEHDQLITPPFWKKVLVSALTAFALMNYVGAEIGFGGLIFTYIHKTGVTSDEEGFLINSAFWLSFTIMRFVCVFISSVISDAAMLILDVIGCFIGIIPLLIAPHNVPCLWIGSIILGASFASQYPLTISLPSSYMRFEVSGWMTSIMIFGGCVGELLVPIGMTLAFEHISPISIFWLIFGVSVIASICYIILLTVFYPKKQKKVEEEEVDVSIPEIH